jgi:hypothetical protein
MKKYLGFTFLLVLILYVLLLSAYLMIEEIIGLFIIPIIVVIIISNLIYLIVFIFKRVNYKSFFTNSLLAACALQIAIVGLILWSASPRYFTREQVINDIDYAIRVAEDVHPNLYAVISKESFYSKTDSIKRLLHENVSDAEAYRTFSKVFSQIHDGHTRGGENFFSNRGSGLFRKTLPYEFDIRNENIFVSKNYFYRNTIPIGSEIIKINGKPTYQCLQEISQLMSYEIITHRNAMLRYPWFWGLWNDFQDFEITYKTPDTKTTNTIKSSGGIISKILFIKDKNWLGKDYSYKTISGNIGYMKFNSFTNLGKFKVFLDSTFKSIKAENINDLIIDIRKNGGGNSKLGDELMQYISKTDFRMFDSCMIKVSNELTNKDWIKYDTIKHPIGSIYNASDSSKTKLRENPLRYSGRTYLLIGGNTFSSATDFASIFQCYKVGKIIGTETGGLTACFGDVYKFELPNTKLDMNVSYKKFVNACGVDNRRGVIPDYIIENSFEDEQKGIDRVLEFTIDLIKQNKK